MAYLTEFIETQRPERIDAWVPPETSRAIAEALEEVGTAYLKPVLERLGGAVTYDEIRVVCAHLGEKRDKSHDVNVGCQ